MQPLDLTQFCHEVEQGVLIITTTTTTIVFCFRIFNEEVVERLREHFHAAKNRTPKFQIGDKTYVIQEAPRDEKISD